MDRDDQNKFKETLLGITITYDKDFSETQVKIWWSLFKSYSIEDFKSAVRKHLLNPVDGMFMPKPAHIIKHIEASVDGKAEMAWAEIVGKISSVGSYGSLTLDDGQALASVTALGGWNNLCSKTNEQLVWMKKEFISVYQNYESTPIDQLPHSLPGRIELESHKKSSSKFITNLKARAITANTTTNGEE